MQRVRRWACGLVLLSGLWAGGAAGTESETGDLERYIVDAMAQWQVPGLAIAIVHGDELVYANGFGVLEAGRSDRVDAQTVFAIGSITKSFTAAALGMLVQEKHLDWHDPVIDHVSGFRLRDPAATMAVTVADLLAHSTGLEPDNLLFWGANIDAEEVLARITAVAQRWPAGTRSEYNNLGYILAGRVIAEVSGISWAEFVQTRLLQPLQMDRSGVDLKSQLDRENVATPHQPRGDAIVPLPRLDTDNAGPAASMSATVIDLAQWIRLHLAAYRNTPDLLLAKDTVETLFRAHRLVPPDSPVGMMYAASRIPAYGFGWMVHEQRGTYIVEHGGQTDGTQSHLMLAPELDLGVVVLTNQISMGLAKAITYRVLDGYRSAPQTDWSTELMTRFAPFNDYAQTSAPGAGEGHVGSLPAANLVGHYCNDRYGCATVDLVDGRLSLSVQGHTAALTHWNYDTYRASWLEAFRNVVMPLVTARPDPAGTVIALDFQHERMFRREGR